MRLTRPNREETFTTSAARTCDARGLRTRRALLVTYLFPPTGGSGVQRAAKLAKYLPQFGWELDVLTAAHDQFPWRDESLLADVHAAKVHRVEGYEPACLARKLSHALSALPPLRGRRKWLEAGLTWRLASLTSAIGLGQGESLWSSAAVQTGLNLCRSRKLEAVISTGPPHFVHHVAERIARETGLPWLADLRDPLVSDFDRALRQRSQIWNLKSQMRRLERGVLAHADAVTTTCTALAADLCTRYPRRWPHIGCITNGYDLEDITPHVNNAPKERQVCTFVAAGAFYGRRELARIVEPLAVVLERNPQWNGRVRLAIAGTLDAEQRETWVRQRPEWMDLLGYVDHASAIRLAAEAACSIVVVPQCGHGMLSVPGKTFELLALPTHILGLVPPNSDSEYILREAGAATTVAFENAPHVAAAMERIISRHFAGDLEAVRPRRAVEKYDRRSIARQFAERLNRLVGAPESASCDLPAEEVEVA